MKTRNPIARCINKFNKPSVIPDRHKEQIEKDRQEMELKEYNDNTKDTDIRH